MLNVLLAVLELKPVHSNITRSLPLLPRAPSQYPKRRLSVRSRQVSKPRDLYLELSDRSEIWQALRQQCCRCACQISKRYYNLKYQSRGFETLRDLTKRRLFGYWDGALVLSIARSLTSMQGKQFLVSYGISTTCAISVLRNDKQLQIFFLYFLENIIYLFSYI